MTPPDYVTKLLSAYAAGKLRPGVVTQAVVMHDADCPFPTGRGPCNCTPDVKLVEPEPAGTSG